VGFSLAPRAVLEGYRLESLDSAGSTNELAIARAMAGETGPVWFVTDDQTSGRGRRGRQWLDARGNLAATLLLTPDFPLSAAAGTGFVAGLALTEALEAVCPEIRLRVAADGASGGAGGRFTLKWPNDVLADGAKLSGILLESRLLPAGGYALAIGIGVNVVSHPQETPYPATSLRKLGSQVTAADLFLALSDAWSETFSLWNSPDGTREVRRRWLKNAAGLGEIVAVQTGDGVRRGRFVELDEHLRFVIRDDAGERIAIAAGDVHFGAVATMRDG
jgi:BirA family biotin operon repressor/biotin-[acetyl-CoA-carboxylase] ligase